MFGQWIVGKLFKNKNEIEKEEFRFKICRKVTRIRFSHLSIFSTKNNSLSSFCPLSASPSGTLSSSQNSTYAIPCNFNIAFTYLNQKYKYKKAHLASSGSRIGDYPHVSHISHGGEELFEITRTRLTSDLNDTI